MKHTHDQPETDPRIQPRLGVAALTRAAFQGRDLAPVASKISSTLVGNEADAAALMDLSVIEQLSGNLSTGLDHQAAALANCQLYETVTKTKHDLDLLILAAPPLGPSPLCTKDDRASDFSLKVVTWFLGIILLSSRYDVAWPIFRHASKRPNDSLFATGAS